jgi:hypothetical protein
MPGLRYRAAIELDDNAEADQHKAQIDCSTKLERELAALEVYLQKTGQSAAALLARVGPMMDEVSRRKNEPYSACGLLNEMVASREYKMWGFHYPESYDGKDGTRPGTLKDGAQIVPIDRKLFWSHRHLIDEHGHIVVTRTGSVVFGEVRFLTEEVDAYLAPGDFAAATAQPARKRRGPVAGTVKRYHAQDTALHPEVGRLIGDGLSCAAAAKSLADEGKVSGRGSPESRARRLAKSYRDAQKLAPTRSH